MTDMLYRAKYHDLPAEIRDHILPLMRDRDMLRTVGIEPVAVIMPGRLRPEPHGSCDRLFGMAVEWSTGERWGLVV